MITLLFRVFSVPQRRHVLILLGSAIGKRLSAVRNERPGLVLGLVRDGEFTLGLGDDPVVAAGDRLLVAEVTGPA